METNLKENQRKKVKQFRDLHFTDDVLIVPNAWDLVSAKLFEAEGFKCVATTSAGVANAMGIQDCERMTIDDNLSVVKRMCNSLNVPVSADVEACYTNDGDELRENAEQIINSGAVGINIEDSLGLNGKPLHNADFQADKLHTIRKSISDLDFDLFINARVNAWMFLDTSKEEKIDECLKRSEAYLNAGADSIFIPDLEDMDEETISIFVKEINAPLNIIAGKNTPPVSRLKELGVKRVSLGPRPLRALLTLLRKISKELLVSGTYNSMLDSSISYSEMNKWFRKKK